MILANLKLQHRKLAEFGDQPKRSFADVIREYSAVKPSERNSYTLKKLYPYFQRHEINKLNGQDIRGYINSRLADNVKPATINRELGLLSAAINYCVTSLDWELPNPVQGRLLPVNNNRDRWLTKDEAQSLITAAQQATRAPHLVHFIELGLNTGMRKSEMLGLEWTRVDLGHGVVYLNSGDQKNKELSAVPLNDTARRVIVERGQYRAEHCPLSPWVFCNSTGRQIKDVKRSFASAAKRAGIDNVHPHDLRRTCGSWLAQAGIPIQQISELLRHSDISITHERYAHLSPSNIADAVAVLDSQPEGLENQHNYQQPASGK